MDETTYLLGDDIRGQYAHDYALDPNNHRLGQDSTRTLDYRGDGSMAMHHDHVLFDAQDGTVDEATGQPTSQAKDDLDQLLEDGGLTLVGAGLRAPRRPDAAEEWLRQHDKNYTKDKASWN
jgi:hypothetical protein